MEKKESKGVALIKDKVEKLMDAVNSNAPNKKGTMLIIIKGSDEEGLHIAMSGQGKDLSVLVAAAMASKTEIKATINHANMLCSMHDNGAFDKEKKEESNKKENNE